MCLDVEFEHTTLDSGHRNARKAHRCEECSRTIEPGERHWYQVIKDDWGAGAPRTVRVCGHCIGTVEMGSAFTGCPQHWFWGQIHDLSPDDGGFVGDILTHDDLTDEQRAAMLATVEGRKSQWRNPDGSLMPVPSWDAGKGAVA